MRNNNLITNNLFRSLGAALLLSFCWAILLSLTASAQSNPVVLENQRSGSSSWQLDNPADDVAMQIKGFASLQSVNVGQPIDLHVHVNVAQTFTIEIYRVGWYNGRGGRLIQSIGPLNGAPQPAPTINAFTGMVTAPWSSTHTLVVPTNWTSGVYLAKLINANGYDNYIVFTVRDDTRAADFLYQHPANTSQAYNNFPADRVLGKSLYRYNSSGANTVAGDRRAVKVSFDRPYAENGAGLFFAWEVFLIRWLEKEGYDVAYSTDADMHRNGASLLNYTGFISAGHDEYWTREMFDSAVAARDAGVNLAFTGANPIYWQSRFENNNRILVVYKNGSIDPEPNRNLKTIKFRDLGRAEQTVVGVQFHSHNNSGSNNTDYIVQNSTHWVYENSGFSDNDSVSKIIGYEIDNLDPNYPEPPANGSQVFLSNSPYRNSSGTVAKSTASIYQASSGAWVFASGTMSWSWGLDSNNYADSRLQQVMKNILNRFVQGEPPILTNPGNQSSLEGAAVALNIRAVDGPSDALIYSATGLPLGLSVNSATGLISGTIGNSAAASYNVSIEVSDGFHNVVETFIWTVLSANQPPSLINPGAQTSTELDTVSLRLSATDPDNNSLTFRVAGLPPGLAISVVTGQITGTISSGTVATYSPTVTVTDGIAEESVSFAWIVNAATNREPVLTLPATQINSEGETVSLEISASDPENDSLTYRASGLPPSLAIASDSGVISGLLSMESSGRYSVTVTVSDTARSVSDSFLWTVLSVNQLPIIVNPGDQTSNANEVVSLLISISDLDNDLVSLDAVGLPPGLSVDGFSGEIFGTLSPDSAGTYTVTLEASDDIDIVSTSFVWTIIDSEVTNQTEPVIDVDCDRDLDAIDALFTLQYAVNQRADHGNCPLADSTTQLHATAGDINADNVTNSVDALFMLQCSVGISNPYCVLDVAGAQSTIMDTTIGETKPVPGFVDVIVKHEENKLGIELDVVELDENSPNVDGLIISAGTFELTYDSSRARLIDCVLVGQGACYEHTNGAIRFAFADVYGLRTKQSIVELTFDSPEIALSEIRALTLADDKGRNLAYEITLHQQNSVQDDGGSYQLFIPLLNR